MTKETIQAAIKINMFCQINFKTYTTPKFGKIVELNDHQSLLNNGFVRFVSLSNYEAFNEATPQKKKSYTLLLSTDNIKHIFPSSKI